MNDQAPTSAEAIERGYNNRAAVPDHPAWFARWARLAEVARTAAPFQADVRYGPNPKETLDIFLPKGEPRGTFVFIHGGYWRSLDKHEHAFVAPPLLAAGHAVVLLNYDLCPDVSIATIVLECRRAIAWIVRDGARHGLPEGDLVVSGHSAGGHLAAMLHATDWTALDLSRNPITAGVSLSGVHDLMPLVQASMNADLRLDAAEAARLSPVHLRPTTDAPFLIAVGADETSEFLRQSKLLWQAWAGQGRRAIEPPFCIPERHHFSVVADYADPSASLTRRTLALFGR
ncbi:MAG: alpha/beta hydrolase [Casimicrobiaceae bacterium]